MLCHLGLSHPGINQTPLKVDRARDDSPQRRITCPHTSPQDFSRAEENDDKVSVKNLTKILIFLLCCFTGCKRITSAERPEWRKVWICSMCFSSADKLSSLHCLYLLDCGSIHAWGACSACWRHRRSCIAWQLWAGYRASARFY